MDEIKDLNETGTGSSDDGLYTSRISGSDLMDGTYPGADTPPADSAAPGTLYPAFESSAGEGEIPDASPAFSAGAPGIPYTDPQPSAGAPEAPYTAPGLSPAAGQTPVVNSGAPVPNPGESPNNAQQKNKPPKKKFSLKDWNPGPQFPNQLTIARICMIPLFVILLLWVPKPAGNILSMIVFILACLTDTADGYIARKYNYVTTFGKFMDPLADKLLVCSALICLVDIGRIESWIVIIIIAREFIISGFRLVAVEKGVVIAANIWGKLKTVVQMLMVILMIGNFGGFLAALTQVFKWAALLLTLISLATYLFQNRKVLNEEV